MDISKQQLLEQIHSLNKELEMTKKENALIPSYLAGLSHDIRTPLNAILGFSGLLTDEGLGNEELSFYSSMIIRSSRKLLSTVSNLIDFAKMKTDNLHLTKEKVEISELFEELEEEMLEEKQLFGKNDINFFFHSPINGSGTIMVDRAKLYQVLRIFLDNSLRYTSQGEIQLVSDVDGSNLGFRISDTGKGMDKLTLESVFSLFTEQDMGLGHKMKTRGLGMAVANELVNLMSGEVLVNSQPRVGTTVSFSLPY